MSSTTSQAMLNQGGLFDQDGEMPSQLGFYSFQQNMSFPVQVGCQQSIKALNIPPPPSLAPEALISSKQQREDMATHLGGGPQLLSLQRSTTANLWYHYNF